MASRTARLIAALLVFATGCAVQVQAPRVQTTPVPGSRPRVVLTLGGIDNISFGATPDVVIRALSAKLGDFDEDSGWVDSFSEFGTCPGGEVRGVRWRRLRVLFSDGPTAVAERGVRHFFAYTLSADLDPRPFNVQTEAGLSLGDTLDRVRAAYPSGELSNEERFGPAWHVPVGAEGGMAVWLTSTADTARVRGIDTGAPTCGE